MADFKQITKTTFQDYGLPSNEKEGSYDKEAAQKDLEYLYQKLNRFSRETTQWDLYKITEVISNQESYRAQVNSLPPYSSAIINTRFLGDDGVSYNKGDLVYKNLDNSVTHVRAERGGVYYLQKIKPATNDTNTDNNYDLTFQYLSHEPAEGTPTEVNYNVNDRIAEIPAEKDITQTLQFNNLPVVAPSDLYGVVRKDENIENGTIVFTAKSTPPVIKMYLSDENQEEVYCDYTLTLAEGENNSFVSGIPSIVTMVVLK